MWWTRWSTLEWLSSQSWRFRQSVGYLTPMHLRARAAGGWRVGACIWCRLWSTPVVFQTPDTSSRWLKSMLNFDKTFSFRMMGQWQLWPQGPSIPAQRSSAATPSLDGGQASDRSISSTQNTLSKFHFQKTLFVLLDLGRLHNREDDDQGLDDDYRKKVNVSYFIRCGCPRCEDPGECGVQSSGLRCPASSRCPGRQYSKNDCPALLNLHSASSFQVSIWGGDFC